jgi:hypothetical protein
MAHLYTKVHFVLQNENAVKQPFLKMGFCKKGAKKRSTRGCTYLYSTNWKKVMATEQRTTTMNTLEYFRRRGKEVGGVGQIRYIRAGNALLRAGIGSLDEVCAMSAEELRRVRNLGEKTLAVVLYERERCRGVTAKRRE